MMCTQIAQRGLAAAPARFVLAGFMALVLGGCSSIIGPGPSPKLYTLNPSFERAAAGEPVNWQLVVATPVATQSLDSVRIALSQTPLTMDYYANAVWVDRAPVMVQGLLVHAFEKSGQISAVARDNGSIRPDYILQTELRNFEARYDVPDTAPVAVVHIGARIIAIPSRKVIGVSEANEEVQASANSVPAVVDAFNRATGAAIAKITTWTLRTAPAIDEEAAPDRRTQRRRH
ncbi:MAG TPA: ABC-type transport auxiliary lipoprotein family protein [Rhizomicrobium sp.]|nr:ABC-type transport auxiliary lipoprotein family protein [Rhizomicrobium sp.]